MSYYRKKPVVIEAVQFVDGNLLECRDFVGSDFITKDWRYYIHTLEGNMEVSVGDFIIKGVQGEFYPCKPDIFEATYDRA
jgi:hypothetical protein